MTRTILGNKLAFNEYVHSSELPAIEIDYSNAIVGCHNIKDMESVSNSICAEILKHYLGTYNPKDGTGEITIEGNRLRLMADSSCATVDVIGSNKTVDVNQIIVELKKKLNLATIEYQDHDKKLPIGKVVF